MKSFNKILQLLLGLFFFLSVQQAWATVLEWEIDASVNGSTFNNSSIDIKNDTIIFVNRVNSANNKLNFEDGLIEGRTYIIDETCKGLILEGDVSLNATFELTVLVIQANGVTIGTLSQVDSQFGNPLFSLIVEGENSSLAIENWGLFYDAFASSNGSVTTSELSVLDGATLTINRAAEYLNLTMFSLVQVIGGNMFIKPYTEYGNYYGFNEIRFVLLDAIVTMDGSFYHEHGYNSFFQIENSVWTVNSLQMFGQYVGFNLGSGANIDIVDHLAIDDYNNNDQPFFNYIGTPESCAKIELVNFDAEAPTPFFSESSSIKLCIPNTARPSFNINEKADVIIDGACEDCIVGDIPLLTDNQSFTGVQVGDTITLTGEFLDSTVNLVVGSTENETTVLPVSIINVLSPEIIEVVVPRMLDQDVIKISGATSGADIEMISFEVKEALPTISYRGDVISFRGVNLLSVHGIDILDQNESGGYVQEDQFLVHTQDEIQIISPDDNYCHTNVYFYRTLGLNFDSFFVSNLFMTPTQVTSSSLNGSGTFQDILLNTCTDGTEITFSPAIDTFYYDNIYLSLSGFQNFPANNVTVKGNGKDQTVLVDSNLISGSVSIYGLEYSFEDLSFHGSINNLDYNSGVFYVGAAQSEIDEGMGLDVKSNVSFNNVGFNNNTSSQTGSGAVYASSADLSFSGCTFDSNTGKNGGAIGVEGDVSLVIENCRFTNNTAEQGGAVYYTSETSSFVVEKSTFINNLSETGGAIYADNAQISLSTFYDNEAEEGAAIWVNFGALFLSNSTVYKNTSTLVNAGAIELNSSNFEFLGNAIGENINDDSDNPDIILPLSTFTHNIQNNCFANAFGFEDLFITNNNIVVRTGGLYLNPVMQTDGLQSYFEPLSISPLVDNYQDVTPLGRGALVALVETDQVGTEITNTRDIGSIELRNAVDPMHITTIEDKDEVGSIRGAQTYFNYHYPSDTLTFHDTLQNTTIELLEGVGFQLLLDPLGAPVDPVTGEVFSKTLFSDASGVQIGLSNEFDGSDTQALLGFDLPASLINWDINGQGNVDSTFEFSCLYFDETGTAGSRVESSVMTNCEFGIYIEQDSFALENSFIYGNAVAGVVLELDGVVNSDMLFVNNNVIGLDNNLNTLTSTNHEVTGLAVIGQGVRLSNGGNIIAGNNGSAILISGSDNYISGNNIGVLDDGMTVVPNKIGIEFLADDRENTTTNTVESNLIVGNEVGVLIPSAFQDSEPTRVYGNIFHNNSFSANDTTVNILDSYQGGVLPPYGLSIVGTVLTGYAEPNALVSIYLDSTDNATLLVDTLRAPADGSMFSFDFSAFTSPDDLPYVTVMQTVLDDDPTDDDFSTEKGSSALSDPLLLDCSVFDDGTFRFGSLEPFCYSSITNDSLTIVAPITLDDAEYSWYGLLDLANDQIFDEQGPELKIGASNLRGVNINLYVEMRLSNGCIIPSDTVIQEFGSAFTFAFPQDTVVVTEFDQSEFINSLPLTSPEETFLWQSDSLSLSSNTLKAPEITTSGEGYLDLEVTSGVCSGTDSIFVISLGDFIAEDDMIEAEQDVVTYITVLENDINISNTSWTISVIREASSGQSTLVTGNLIEYAPSLGFVGLDTVSYQISDEYGRLDTALVVINVVEDLQPTIEIDLETNTMCSNDEMEVYYSAFNFVNPNSIEPIWTVEGGSFTEIKDSIGQSIGIILMPDQNTSSMLISLDVSDGDTTLFVSEEVSVVGINKLADFTLDFNTNTRDSLVSYEEDGQIIFGCGQVEPQFTSDSGLIAINLPSLISENTTVDLIISDASSVCTDTSSFEVVFNEKLDTVLDFAVNTGVSVVSSEEISINGYHELDSVNILTTELQYGTVAITDEDRIEYVSDTNIVGVSDVIELELVDVCGIRDTISYIAELFNTEPEIKFDEAEVVIVLAEESEVTVTLDELAFDPNLNHYIELLNQEEFDDYLSLLVTADVLNSSAIVVSVTGDIPEDILYADVEYQVCDEINGVRGNNCREGLLRVLFEFEEDGSVLIQEGIIQSDEADKKLEIVRHNTAVTNNVPLTFKFKWGGELINASELEYDVVIMSRWGDVVYQDKVSGEKIDWNGNYQLAGADTKVPEGNYSWVIRVFYVNSKGKLKSVNETGILYYVNTESSNVLED